MSIIKNMDNTPTNTQTNKFEKKYYPWIDLTHLVNLNDDFSKQRTISTNVSNYVNRHLNLSTNYNFEPKCNPHITLTDFTIHASWIDRDLINLIRLSVDSIFQNQNMYISLKKTGLECYPSIYGKAKFVVWTFLGDNLISTLRRTVIDTVETFFGKYPARYNVITIDAYECVHIDLDNGETLIIINDDNHPRQFFYDRRKLNNGSNILLSMRYISEIEMNKYHISLTRLIKNDNNDVSPIDEDIVSIIENLMVNTNTYRLKIAQSNVSI